MAGIDLNLFLNFEQNERRVLIKLFGIVNSPFLTDFFPVN